MDKDLLKTILQNKYYINCKNNKYSIKLYRIFSP